MLKLLLSGACGRMGREIAARAAENGVRIVAGIDLKGEAYADFPVFPSFHLYNAQEPADVLCDFSRAENLQNVLEYAVEKRLPLVLAATGYQQADIRQIQKAAESIPVFRSANMSLGVQVLRILSRQASRLLQDFDIEIVEKHHNQKLDAPSGTAEMLYDAVAKETSEPVYGRHGRTQRREKNEIGLLSVRGGTVPGEHEVGFYGPGETVLLTHSAQDRSIFALGALRAMKFIAGQAGKPGEYGMDDLIHL